MKMLKLKLKPKHVKFVKVMFFYLEINIAVDYVDCLYIDNNILIKMRTFNCNIKYLDI